MSNFDALEKGYADFKALFKHESLAKHLSISVFGILDNSLSPARKAHKFFAASKEVGMYYEDIPTQLLIDFGRASPAAVQDVRKEVDRMLGDLRKSTAPQG